MIIKGTEYGFCLTLDAGIKIAKICPDKELTNFRKLIDDDDYEEAASNLATIADILNEGYCRMEWNDYGRKAERITKDTILTVLKNSPMYVYTQLYNEVIVVVVRDLLGEIEAEEKTGKKEETGAEA